METRLTALLFTMLLLTARSKAPQAVSVEETDQEFPGSSACHDCHAPQYAGWMTSDHALGMGDEAISVPGVAGRGLRPTSAQRVAARQNVAIFRFCLPYCSRDKSGHRTRPCTCRGFQCRVLVG